MDVQKIFDDASKKAEVMLGRGFDIDHEVELALFEWGLKKELRLFATVTGIMSFSFPDEEAEEQLRVKGYFTDTSFKTLVMYVFDIDEKTKTIELAKEDGNLRWPIGYARTKEFQDDNLYPVGPLYNVLVDRGIILPFSITFDDEKEWELLPFVTDNYLAIRIRSE